MTSKKTFKVFAFSYFFQEMFLSKDIFLVPYYIAKEKEGRLSYLYQHNTGNTIIPSDYRGSKIKESKIKSEILSLLWNIVIRVWTIDLLFLNGSSAKHMLIVWLYKMLNPKGHIVIFGDMEREQAEEFAKTGLVFSTGISAWLKKLLTNYFFNHVTYIVANTEAYRIMKELCNKKGWKEVLNFYPCLDNEIFESYGLKRIPFEQKENIIICVGRIGNHQKNTEMLLKALEKVDLKDWIIFMIGPITSSFDLKENGDFQKTIDSFFNLNPQYRDRLIFTGPIYNQEDMLSYYVRAKVLLSTARHEGFANVYSQAAALGCYVISTNVGGADVGSNHWQFGVKIEQDDSDGLALTLNKLVKGEIKIDKNLEMPYKSMCYSYRIKNILIPHINNL